MKISYFAIRTRQFIDRDGRLLECLVGTDGSWSGFSIFIPAGDPEALKNDLAKRAFRYIDVYASQEPAGVWLLSGYHWLDQIRDQLPAAG